MSLPTPTGFYRAEAAYAGLLNRVGLVDGRSVFEHPKIDVWRSITERENGVLDYTDGGRVGRLHVKRNKPGHRGVEAEADAVRLLTGAGIATVPLVAAGRLNDGRGFLVTDDLSGFDDADLRVKAGLPFETLLGPTAALAGRLHAAGLHHRDLYLCHFYVSAGPRGTGVPPVSSSAVSSSAVSSSVEENTGGTPVPRDGASPELRLMDAGRVRRLPQWFRRRWLVKDVAQFVYSLRQSAVSEALIERWLAAYSAAGGAAADASFRRAVGRKVAAIARHDAALRQRDPTRNVSIDR